MNETERNHFIVEQLNAGTSLSDLQKMLSNDYGIKMTYLELRLLTADLAVNWEKQDKPKPKSVAISQSEAAPAPSEEAALPEENRFSEEEEEEENPEEASSQEPSSPSEEESPAGQTLITLDETPIPGALMSGSATFASGVKGKWMLDRMGSLGLTELEDKSKQPTQEDIQLFQEELQKMAQKRQQEMLEKAFDGRTKVEISPLVRPGCDINGTVEFASGAKGEWFIIQGKLDFDLDPAQAKPTREDLSFFQLVLRKQLQEKGYR